MTSRKQQITKLIIPLAGRGTRFFPTSLAYPKEMLHLVDQPVIQHIVEEAYQAGIREILFVLTRRKAILADYFSDTPDKTPGELVKLIQGVKFRTIWKVSTRGDGHSLWCARKFLGPNEAFAVSMGDLLSFPGTSIFRELVGVYQKTGEAVISVERIPKELSAKFGIIDIADSRGKLSRVRNISEKPKSERAPSNLAMTGKYILTPEIFPYLQQLMKRQEGELRLSAALADFARDHVLQAYECSGAIQDTGNKLDFLKATVTFGIHHPTFGKPLRDFIRSLKIK